MDGEGKKGFSTRNIAAVDDRGDFIGLNLNREGFIFGVDFSEFRDGGDETAGGRRARDLRLPRVQDCVRIFHLDISSFLILI